MHTFSKAARQRLVADLGGLRQFCKKCSEPGNGFDVSRLKSVATSPQRASQGPLAQCACLGTPWMQARRPKNGLAQCASYWQGVLGGRPVTQPARQPTRVGIASFTSYLRATVENRWGDWWRRPRKWWPCRHRSNGAAPGQSRGDLAAVGVEV